ncbi:MAG: SRPBCC family protein [Chloroflexota bacterium]|nr:SRPBCC family protein [Chloroflexota bacterium]
MAKITRTITINAPVEKVFGYMTDPTNLPEIWPSMVEVKDAKLLPEHVGSSFAWVYKMAGMRFKGSSEVTEHVTSQRQVTKSTKGIQSMFVWTYQPEGGGTKLTVDLEYTIPVPLLGKLAEAFIVKLNEHEADVLLANLKARMEA